MAQYVQGERWSSVRRVIDFVDVDSDKWRQYAHTKHWPASWVYRREADRLEEAEARLAHSFDASVFVSDHEAALFRRRVADVAERVAAVSNGVDAAFFSSDLERPLPYPPLRELVVFTGAMDYWANVDAVGWFVREVWPRVREKRPQALFCIVGARPTPEVVALGCSDVQVTGWVPDVRPYLQQARVVVAPLRIARGIQNKVLEGMAMGKPVVVTSRGYEGINAVPGRDLLVCDAPEAYAEAIVALLAGAGKAIGANARRLVVERYDWGESSQRLIALVRGYDRSASMT
jgi:sugar transferase (PEP-CTERM/EpsH1 system associated)